VEQRPALAQLNRAVVLLNSPSGRCTGTYVSSDGAILTARHCLQICLIRSGVVREVSEQDGAIVFYETVPERLGVATCELEINGVPQTVTVEATGPGFVMPFNMSGLSSLNPALMKDLIARGYTSSGDFAIVRQRVTTPTACVALAQAPAQPGDFVQSIEYPAATERPDGYNSDGEQAYASGGVVAHSIAENSCVVEASPPAERLARLMATFDDASSFVSSLDSNHGASGSPVFNAKGEVVGILINIYRHTSITQKQEDEPEVRFCLGSSKALRIERVLSFLPWRVILNCARPPKHAETKVF